MFQLAMEPYHEWDCQPISTWHLTLFQLTFWTQSNWMLWTSVNYVWNHLSILTSTVFQSSKLKTSSMMKTFHWIFSDGDSFLAWHSMPSLWTSQVLSWLFLGSTLLIETRELVLVCHVICLNVEKINWLEHMTTI